MPQENGFLIRPRHTPFIFQCLEDLWRPTTHLSLLHQLYQCDYATQRSGEHILIEAAYLVPFMKFFSFK
jgi:hypothetical protein